jgi:hypothetical protein
VITGARRAIELTMADIFGQYITDFKVLPGRNDGQVTMPYFAVVAEEVLESPRGSGIYLGVIKFIAVTDSNVQSTGAQDARIGECMELVRSLSNTLCNANQVIVEPALNLTVDGIAQMSQFVADEDQAYEDEVELRIGFRQTNVAPNTPTTG